MKIKCACGEDCMASAGILDNELQSTNHRGVTTNIKLTPETMQQLIKALQEELGRMAHAGR